MNARLNAKIVHEVGVNLCLKHLECNRLGPKLKVAGVLRPVMVHTQNEYGDVCTIWLTGGPGFIQNLKSSDHIFVTYSKDKVIKIYLGKDCADENSYTMEQVAGIGLALKYPIANMTLLKEVNDMDAWMKLHTHSNSREHNLDSTFYR